MNEIAIAMIGAGASITVGLLSFLGVVVTNKKAKFATNVRLFSQL